MLSLGTALSQCTGCAACMNICQYDAIQMREAKDGFKYPVIDAKKCVLCKKCVSVCKLQENIWEQNCTLEFPVVYAMCSRNEETRIHSTSGGIFTELAECVLRRNGNVAGAAYRPDWSAEHRMICNIEDLEMLRRSKYQQSDINFLFREVKGSLNRQEAVLVCGTPCQIAGLKAFLGREYDNLIACDFICRGVSSPRLFAKYIEDLRNAYGSDIEYIWMKNKCNGWHNLTTVIGFENGKKYIKSGLEDSYVQMYLKYNAGVRKSCYQCRFKGERNVADITLGDFWGLENTPLDDNMGTSAVICRTEKGRRLVEEMKGRVLCEEKRIEDVKRGNPCLCEPIEQKTSDMDTFYDILEREGYQQAVAWIAENNI